MPDWKEFVEVLLGTIRKYIKIYVYRTVLRSKFRTELRIELSNGLKRVQYRFSKSDQYYPISKPFTVLHSSVFVFFIK